jgi:RNA polymerase sigma-70 factor, ECF subfamily
MISTNDVSEVTLDNFEALYEKFGPMVLRRCRYILKDEEKALDAMQDVFVRILERKNRLDGVCSSLFYTVATSVCLNKIRSDKIRRGPQIDNLLDAIADNNTAFHEEVTDASMLLENIFTDTKDDTRTMAVLHYVDGLTLEETANEMKMSVSGVRKRLSVLRKKALECAGA